MFQIFEQCFTKDELKWFHNDMQTLKLKNKKQDSLEKQYRDPSTHRWELPNNLKPNNISINSVRKNITEKLLKLLPKHQIYFLAYSEQTKPSRLHCDSYGGQFGATCIIPLKEYGDGNDQTLVFDRLSKNGETLFDISQKIKNEMLTSKPKNKNSRFYKLEHIIDNKKILNPCDWMDLLGVFPYKYGNMVAFDKRLLHCSNNWFATDNTRKHKDFIIIHTIVPNE